MPVRKTKLQKSATEWIEIGQSGIHQAEGFVSEAYNAELNWPGVQPLYNRIRRSDPEVTIVRNGLSALVKRMTAHWELPDNANDDEKAAQEFGEEVMDDVEGGVGRLMEQWVSQVLMMGWGYWSVVPGLRKKDWTPPGDDPWRSQYDDGYIGFRRFAWRDTSSFMKWKFGKHGHIKGMYQSQLNSFASDLQAERDPEIFLPLEKSLHMTYGDPHNPEGLSPLESVWRLERLKHGLEMVMGIGFEHAAGYLNITTEKSTMGAGDESKIKEAALRILTAQEGNYAAWPKGYDGELKDVPFHAAQFLLETIRYYGILKMTVFNMQWMAMSSLTGTGSFAALGDSSTMALLQLNAIMEGFADQFDRQVGRRLFTWNADRFPNMVHRPRFRVSPVEKVISLQELGQFLQAISGTIPITMDDLKAIRKQTHFLPTTEQEGEPLDAPGNDQTNEDEPAPEPQPNPQKVEQSMYPMIERAKEIDPELYSILVEGHNGKH